MKGNKPKTLNKLPVVIIASVLVIAVVSCFIVVNRQQNKQVKTQDIEIISTNKQNTPIPDLTVDGTNQVYETSQVDATNQIEPVTKDVFQKPEPVQVQYQSAPQPTPSQIYQEQLKRQKLELARKALSAPISAPGNQSTNFSQPEPIHVTDPNIETYLKTLNIPKKEQPDQTQKQSFLSNAANHQVTLVNAYQEPLSPFELKQGHLIPITLITQINSDLPGHIKAQVTENVYDTATGNYLLIPVGTMVNGIYDSRVVFGQSRVLIAWQRLIFPDGASLNLGSMPGTDQAGTAGLKDLVNNHYFKIFGSAILMSVVNAGFTIVTDTDSQRVRDNVQDSLAKSSAQQMQRTFSTMLEKIMNVQPELKIRQGKPGNIILIKDIIGLKPYNPAKKPTYYLSENP